MSSINEMIEDLSQDLAPLTPLAHPLVRVMPWLFIAIPYVAGVVYILGIRPDLPAKIFEPFFVFELSIMMLTGLAALLCSAWLCVPDMRGQSWLLPIPFSLLSVFVLWNFVRLTAEPLALQAPHWDHCFVDGTLMGFVPALMIIALGRGGATTRPFIMALLNLIAVSALGYVALRLTCANDTIGHSTLYHLFPFVTLGGLFGLFARRVFKW